MCSTLFLPFDIDAAHSWPSLSPPPPPTLECDDGPDGHTRRLRDLGYFEYYEDWGLHRGGGRLKVPGYKRRGGLHEGRGSRLQRRKKLRRGAARNMEEEEEFKGDDDNTRRYSQREEVGRMGEKRRRRCVK